MSDIRTVPDRPIAKDEDVRGYLNSQLLPVLRLVLRKLGGMFNDPPERSHAVWLRGTWRPSDGFSRRWLFTDTLAGNGTIQVEYAIPCDTAAAPAITIDLPPIDDADIGLEAAIQRLVATGSITLAPSGGATLDGSILPMALPTLEGFYVIVLSPTGYVLE